MCAEAGRHGDLIAHKSEKSGKRFIRCTNYDDCGVSYPLPARGKLEATGETCPRVRRSHRGGQHGARSVAYLRQHGLPDQGEEARPRSQDHNQGEHGKEDDG